MSKLRVQLQETKKEQKVEETLSNGSLNRIENGEDNVIMSPTAKKEVHVIILMCVQVHATLSVCRTV